MTSARAKLPANFRLEETKRLMSVARAGESASVIGVSGVGKSNLFNHVLNRETQQRFLGDDAWRYVFIRVNFHYMPDYDDRSAYSLIVEQMELLDERAEWLRLDPGVIEQIGRYHDNLLDAGDDILDVQRQFKLAVRSLLRNSDRKLILLFDQFDDLFIKAHPRLFANLRGLRETYKYRISYLTFTRRPLPDMVEVMDRPRDEFYELLTANEIGLKPYNERDAMTLLTRICERNQLPLMKADLAPMMWLTGGHAGLLRATYLAIKQEDVGMPRNEKEAVRRLLSLPNPRAECDKIWVSLQKEEQKALSQHHAFGRIEIDGWLLDQLKLKGMLTSNVPPRIFSALFREYVDTMDDVWEHPIRPDDRTFTVWVMGRQSQTLTPLEFRIFMALYDRRGEVVTYHDLIRTGWPDAPDGVSQEALLQLMRRLRLKIEPDPDATTFIENTRGVGYRLRA